MQTHNTPELKTKPGISSLSEGRLHLYWGEGKGKTTAAVGLTVRAAGAGCTCCFLQFLKTEDSSERRVLEHIPQVILPPLPRSMKFVFQMNEAEKRDTSALCSRLLKEGEACLRQGCGLAVLDEVLGAIETGLLPEQELLGLLDRWKKEGWPGDLVLTGRFPSAALQERADYSTEMRCIRHPYENGVPARKGIEY